MANPSTRWDPIPVFGVYDVGTQGDVSFTFAQRVLRVDGRTIYTEGKKITVKIGLDADQDPEIRTRVHDAWYAEDQAKAAATGVAFDSTAWGVWWDTVVKPWAIFLGFPAMDDPDIVHDPANLGVVSVREILTNGAGKPFPIQPLLAHLDQPIPGINLGFIQVPPGSPSIPAPVYAKGVAGGVASLDATGKVPMEQIPDGIGGGDVATVSGVAPDEDGDVPLDAAAVGARPDDWVPGWDEVSGKPAVVAAGADQAAARAAIGVLAATTVLAGLVELATTAEATAGTDTTRAVTPAGLKAAIDALVGAAPGALDTLAELAAALGSDASFSTTVASALAARVRTDTATQGLTSTQQSNARANIGAGTSNLQVGTGATDAKAGNWTPAAADIPNLAASKITSGTFDVARVPELGLTHLPAGATFCVKWDVDHWEDADGTTITARPTARTDLVMLCITTGTTPPVWAIDGDMLLRIGS